MTDVSTQTGKEPELPAGTDLYTVTKHAGPKVAGRVAEPGATLILTENEARGELVAGTIVLGKKGDNGFVDDPLAIGAGDKPKTKTPAKS